MAYRYDKDLEFLKNCSDEDLKELVNVLTTDPKDGATRWTETLTKSDEYSIYREEYSKYWERIAEELQLFGGNSLVNFGRGFLKKDWTSILFGEFSVGVPYREIAMDVAKHLKINISGYAPIEEIEDNILEKILEDIFKSLTESQKEEIFKEMEIGKILEGKNYQTDIKKSGTLFIAKEIFKRGGFASYQLSVIIANMLWKFLFKRGLSFTANKTLTKTIARVLPGVNLIANVWLIKDITDAAMRVTIPAVILIATLRKKNTLPKE